MHKSLSFVVKVLLIAFVFCAVSNTSNAATTDPYPYETYRSWVYLDINAIFNPTWSLHIMPGHSYEYGKYKNNGDFDKEGKYFFGELFIGPWYSMKLSDKLSFKIGLEYYLMQFDTDGKPGNNKYYNHCVEVIPVVTYNITDSLFFRNRIIFHNILNSSMMSDTYLNKTKESEWGYSMTIREMVVLGYKLNPTITLLLQDEIFYSTVKNSKTSSSTGGRSFDYETGFYQNRFYAGGSFKLTPEMALTALYLLRHDFAQVDAPGKYGKGDVTTMSHYIQLILTYNIPL